MSEPGDLTLPPDLSLRRRTGPTRQQRPVYVDLLPPCNEACPAGENIQAWLALAQAGRFRDAWDTILQDNPLPAIHGRVCYHPCESSCNRTRLDGTVSIHAVERFLGDLAITERWTPAPVTAPTGRRILVVGAGPSGLSAAHHLSRLGHTVEVRDAGPVGGGMMRFGIPAYRLPRPILDAEIERIARGGVQFTFNHTVKDLLAEKEAGGFDAVFIAVGAHLSKRTSIPSRDAGRILDAVAFLKDVEAGQAPKLGRRVAIYGGGNTAMDAARVALRLGHAPLIVYRRDYAHMPAHHFEADDAMAEGVAIHWLRSITSFDATQMTVEIMALDEQGRPKPTGEFETLAADDLILALGQDTDTGFLRGVPGIAFKDDGSVVVSPQFETGHRGIFAGGDMVPAERTVTVAVGHGKKAARAIDAWLRGTTVVSVPKKPVATYESLHLWFYIDAAKRPQSLADMARRRSSFAEVVQGLSEPDAVHEASRCLSCGNCFECDACYGACPEDAIIKLGPGNRYEYDYAKCTGCAVCFEQCPCHAISMIPEPPSGA